MVELSGGKSETLATLSYHSASASTQREHIRRALALTDGRFPIVPEALDI